MIGDPGRAAASGARRPTSAYAPVELGAGTPR